MPKVWRVLLVLPLFLFISKIDVFAGCEVSLISPATEYLDPETANSFEIGVRNTGDSAISWIKIPVNFSASWSSITTDIQGSGWEAMFGSEANTFWGGSISPGDTTRFSITGITGLDGENFNWTWQSSIASYGVPAEDCNTINFQITNTPPTPTPLPTPLPILSELTVVAGSTTAVVTWRSDVNATGSVEYGETTGYGVSASGDSSVQAHSVSLTGLKASTTYHFRVSSANENGTTTSSDNVFTTGTAGTTTTVTTTVTNIVTTTTTTTVTKLVTDTTPPVISILTDFEKPFAEAPTIKGKASDAGAINAGVAMIEYSIDGGKNWLPVDTIDKVGAKSTGFEFTPVTFEDGNYKVRVRAKDATGNKGLSSERIMVIDRLPPQVGGVLFSVGPQVLVPDRGGVIYSLAGTTQKVTVSSVGGATSIDIVAGNSSFGLRKNLDNGLWSGELLFNEGGSYDLKAKSIDGAENKTDRELNRVVVLPSGVVRSEDKGILSKATVSVFYFEPTAGEFVLWDGSAFGQVNPQKTDSEGRYGFLVPPGKYFVEVEMSGYRGVRTKIFSLKQTTPLNMDFVLRLFEGIQVGPFKIGILLLKDEVDFKQASFQGGLTSSEKIVGNEMPYFSFPGDGFSLSTNDLKGKSTVVSFLSIWAPQAYEQLSILNELGVKEINNLVIMSQDSSAKVNTYKKIGGYKVRMVSDVDGELVEPLGILNIPTHIFLDRKGVVKKKLVGVLSKEELLDNIIN